MAYYDPEDIRPTKSPLLAPVRPRLEPDPLDWRSDDETDLEDLIYSNPPNRALRRRKRADGPKGDMPPSLRRENPFVESWRDMVLVHEMDPRRGWDVALEAARVSLPSEEDNDWGDLDNPGNLQRPDLDRDLGGHVLRAAPLAPLRPINPQRREYVGLPPLEAGSPGVFTQVKLEAPTPRYYFSAREVPEYANRSASETPPPPENIRPRRRRKRFALPLLVARPSGAPIEVMACPDSGSDENIISLELATSLGLKTKQTDSDEPRQFSVANGKIVTAVGQVSTSCRFAAGGPSDITNLECIFHVFNTLAVPLIMGVDFLQRTETLSKHRDRLVEQVVPAMQSLRVNSIGRPKRSLVCRLDTYVGCATVDTGSDLDLVSPAFAKARAYKIEPAYEQIEFADCSVGCTSGVIKTSLAVGNVSDVGFQPRGEPIDLELFVLDNLNADILVGQDTVDMLDVFNLHSESLIPSIPKLGESDVNIIRHIGSLEKGVSKLWKKMRGNQSDTSVTGVEAQVDIDQRENARRERERARIAKLSGPDRERAQELEDMTIQAFEAEKQRRLSPLPSIRSVLADMMPPRSAADVDDSEIDHMSLEGGYKCTFPGCTAQPFQTQHLLNSHFNIHVPARPHYCPVEGCPRGRCGKGFKTRKEMFRHSRAHDLTGYVYTCPFCPDEEHEYRRPDHLRRHVREHHVDKDKDDPLLKQVLAQQLAGPKKGRRRKDPRTFYGSQYGS